MNLPELFQMIYVTRNVKDAAVSLFHHMKLEGCIGVFKDHAKLFRKDLAFYNPFFLRLLEAW